MHRLFFLYSSFIVVVCFVKVSAISLVVYCSPRSFCDKQSLEREEEEYDDLLLY